jgi:hypothetical protein
MEILPPESMDEPALQSAYSQLRPVERAFVDAYIGEMQKSATAAGQRIIDFINSTGKHPQGYNPRSTVPARQAKAMLEKPLVKAAITERVNELTEAMELTAFRVVSEVAAIATSNIINFYKVENGVVSFDPAKATPEQWATVKSMKVKEVERPYGGIERTYEIELHPKLTALDMLMKYKGMYSEDNAQRQLILDSGGQKNAAIPANASVADAADMYARTLRRGVA